MNGEGRSSSGRNEWEFIIKQNKIERLTKNSVVTPVASPLNLDDGHTTKETLFKEENEQ